MNDPRAVRELEQLCASVHPGKRIRPVTLLRNRIEFPEVRALLRNFSAFRNAVETMRGLSSLACTGLPDPDGPPIVLRRRFAPEERRAAVLDLNNLVWSLEESRICLVVEELRRCGVESVQGVGDANLPFLVDPGTLAEIRSVLDGLVLAAGGNPADGIILDEAETRRAMIVSNDMFRDWRRTSAWRRRNIHRLRVPVTLSGLGDRSFSLGEPGLELRSPPLVH